MNSFSYSKVDTSWSCPYLFKLRYIDKLEVFPDKNASSPLYLGTACHTGIETRDLNKAIESYKSNYDEITSDNEFEISKLKESLNIAMKEIPEGEYERKIVYSDGFLGFIDSLVKIDEGLYDMYDYKYSNNASGYGDSAQLHVYKYYFELITGEKIRNMYYAMVPKFDAKLNESVDEYFKDKHVTFIKVEYDQEKVNHFFAKKAMMEKIIKNGNYTKRRSWKCRWCDYRKLCESCGKDRSELKDPSQYDKANLQEINLF